MSIINDTPIPTTVHEVIAQAYHPDCIGDIIKTKKIAAIYEAKTHGFRLPAYPTLYDLSTKKIDMETLKQSYLPSAEVMTLVRATYQDNRKFPDQIDYEVKEKDADGNEVKIKKTWKVPAVLPYVVYRQGKDWHYKGNGGSWIKETPYNLKTSLMRDFYIPELCMEPLIWALHGNIVEGVMDNPFVPVGLQNPDEHGGRRVLNTSTWSMLAPAMLPAKWEDSALDLWRPMIEGMFNHGPEGDLQFRTFQQVMRRMVRALYHKQTQFHQHVHIASAGTGCGKSGLLAALGIMVKGNTFNIAKMLDGGFNGAEMNAVLWTMDDEVIDTKRAEALTPLIKQLVSNPVKVAEAKYADRVQKTQLNPIFTVSNMSEMGLAMVPKLGPDTRDKTHLFVIRRPEGGFVFPEMAEFKRAMTMAMPSIIRYYLDSADDKDLLRNRDPRYQITPFHHPDLDNASKLDENRVAARAILELFAEERSAIATITDWTAAKLLKEIQVEKIPCEYKQREFGKALVALADTGASWISIRKRADINRYTINLDHLRGKTPRLVTADLTAYGISHHHQLTTALTELDDLRAKLATFEQMRRELAQVREELKAMKARQPTAGTDTNF